MNRLNKILLTLLTIQIAMTAWAFMSSKGSGLGEARLILSRVEAGDVERIVITSEEDDEDADRAPARVTLEKREGGWHVLPVDYAGDQQSIEDFAAKVTSLRSRGPITESASRHRQLEVSNEDHRRKIEMVAGEVTETLLVGDSPGFRKTYVRVQGQDAVHAVEGLSVWEANEDPMHWIDKAYVKVEPHRVRSFSIHNGQGDFELRRVGDQQWAILGNNVNIPEDFEIKHDKVERLLSSLSKLRLEDIADTDDSEKQGIDTPVARMVLTTDQANAPTEIAASDGGQQAAPTGKGAQILTLRIGAENDGRRYLRLESQPRTVEVASSSLEQWVNFSLMTIVGPATDTASEAQP